MNYLKVGILVVSSLCIAGTAFAIQPGKTVTWDTPMGKVVFDGKKHFDAKVPCLECHSKIFKMIKSSTQMHMADIHAGKFCGKCHNGKRSFATSDMDNCSICHLKVK